VTRRRGFRGRGLEVTAIKIKDLIAADGVAALFRLGLSEETLASLPRDLLGEVAAYAILGKQSSKRLRELRDVCEEGEAAFRARLADIEQNLRRPAKETLPTWPPSQLESLLAHLRNPAHRARAELQWCKEQFRAHPIFAFEAWRIARIFHIDIPVWVLEYLDGCANRLHSLVNEPPEQVGDAAAVAFGFTAWLGLAE